MMKKLVVIDQNGDSMVIFMGKTLENYGHYLET
jgi:hypothetical protein